MGLRVVPLLAQHRQRLLAVVLLLLGVLAWWVARQGPVPEQRGRVSDARQPDYVVDGLSARIFDQDGRLSRRVDAVQLRHYPQDDSTELDEPRLVLHVAPEAGSGDSGSGDFLAPPWHLRARHGWVASEGEQVILQGEVWASRAAAGSGERVEFRTSEIALFPSQEYAETDRFVAFETGTDRLTAVNGMRFWYGESQRARFIGRVRARILGESPAGSP